MKTDSPEAPWVRVALQLYLAGSADRPADCEAQLAAPLRRRGPRAVASGNRAAHRLSSSNLRICATAQSAIILWARGLLILLFKHSSDSFGRVCQGSFAFLVSLSLAEGILAPRFRGALQADASRQIEVFFFLFPSFGGVRLAGGSSIGSADLLSGIRPLLERASLWTDL